MPSVTAKGCFLCIWEIYLQLVLVRGTNFRLYIYQITNKRYWIMSGLYIIEISFLQLISLY